MLDVFHYRMLYQTRDALPAVYTGSAWRGAFGHALLALDETTYREVFEVRAENGGNDTHGIQPPQPYVISPSFSTQSIGDTTQLNVDLILIGKANAYAGTCINALDRGAQNILGASFRCTGMTHFHPVAGFVSLSTTPRAITVQDAPTAPTNAELTLEHPLRLRNAQGKNIGQNELAATDWASSVVRRLHHLSSGYGNGLSPQERRHELDLCNGIMFGNRKFLWHDQKRHSNRQGKDVPLGGLLGNASVSGPGLQTLWPSLWLGQWLHTGKGAVMGMGRYRLG